MEEETYTSILFDLKSPNNYRHSVINSLVLLLRDIASMEECQRWDKINVQILNENIERMKKELDNLKIIKFEE